MDTLIEWLIGFISDENNPLALVTIGLAAAIEYVFPPFPGDSITLFSALLITARQWNFAAVFGAIMLGSMAGSMAAFYLGQWWHGRRQRRPDQPGPPGASGGDSALDTLVARFRRHGAIYLVVNRFLPGLRGVFFVAAGLAGMRPLPVLLYGALSAALWNLLLVGAGAALGANFDTLRQLVERYTAAAWIVLAMVALGLLFGAHRRRRRRRRRTPP